MEIYSKTKLFLFDVIISEKPLKIHFHCDSESGSVNIHGKNFYLNHPGVSFMKISLHTEFRTGYNETISRKFLV